MDAYRFTRERLLTGYIAVLSGLAATVLTLAAVRLIAFPTSDTTALFSAVLLVPFVWLASRRQVYYTESNRIALGTIGQIATVLVLPTEMAVWVVACAKALTEVSVYLSHRVKARAALVNVANWVLAVAGSSTAFHLLHGPHFLWVEHSLLPLAAFPALLAVAVVNYSIDTLVVGLAITLSTKERLYAVLAQMTKDTLLSEMSLIVVGIVFGVMWHFSPVLSLFSIVPIYLCVKSFAAVAQLRDETEKAVSHMAKSVDLRDVKTGEHSQQLEIQAKRLAAALGLTPEHVHEIGLAARAHDLGKIEISDAILLKPGPLSADERKEMEEHPVIGATMLSSYSAFSKSVAFVRHHHERWDGKGYPDGLAGENIPIGSRVIAVVDSYDAMTADRPYRKALPVEEAVNRLKAGMGSQFDPTICAKWIELLINDGTYIPDDSMPRLHLVSKEAS